jgi:hypothetical protein
MANGISGIAKRHCCEIASRRRAANIASAHAAQRVVVSAYRARGWHLARFVSAGGNARVSGMLKATKCAKSNNGGGGVMAAANNECVSKSKKRKASEKCRLIMKMK